MQYTVKVINHIVSKQHTCKIKITDTGMYKCKTACIRRLLIYFIAKTAHHSAQSRYQRNSKVAIVGQTAACLLSHSMVGMWYFMSSILM